MKTLVVAVVLFTQNLFAHGTLFEENFHSLESSQWIIEMLGTASFQTDSSLTLNLEKNTPDTSYSNAAVATQQLFRPSRFEITALSTPTEKGSRGWGFWNSTSNPVDSAIAWFIYLEGDENYPLNGFFASVQKKGSTPEFYPLNVDLLNEPRNYAIEWSKKGVQFFVDGNLVAESESKITTEMRVHLWQDNAVYDLNTFKPLLQKIETSQALVFKSMRIFK